MTQAKTAALAKTDEVIFGAGELYLEEFTGNVIPAHEAIEIAANHIADCDGGFSVEYKPERTEVRNQHGKVIRAYVTSEEMVIKTGILTWLLKNIEILSTATLTEDQTKKIRKLTFGSGGQLKNVLIRFVHTKKDNGKKLRFTMIGYAGNGFSLDFSGSGATTIDAEFSSIEAVKGFLAEIEEEME